jgi:hypothetical protein
MASQALKGLTIGLGLKADHACTADASRVLRPVGTLNWKDPDFPKPVELVQLNDDYEDGELIDRLVEAAQPFKSLVVQRASDIHAGTQTGAHAAHADALQGALDVSLPKSAEPIIVGCRQIRNAAFAREDVWRGMLSVIRLCTRGDDWCHVLSARDRSRYHREDTRAKLAVLSQQQGPGGMPMTCAMFNEKRPGVCGDCAHRGEIRSPVVLGLAAPAIATATAEPVNLVHGDAPHDRTSACGFAVPHATSLNGHDEIPRLRDARFELVLPHEADAGRPAGVTYLDHYKDDDGAEKVRRVPICRQAIYVRGVGTARDAEGHAIYVWVVNVYDQGIKTWYEVSLPGRLFWRPADLLCELSERGVTIAPVRNAGERLVDYMRAYVEQIRRVRAPVAHHARFGWTADDAFVLGARVYRAGAKGGIEVHPVRLERTASSMTHALEPAGSLADWKRAANLYARPGQQALAFAFFTTFGAPLLRFTECPGFLVHLTGESGTGKTSLQRIAAAAWGNPQALMQHAPTSKYGSTRNALMAELGVLHNVPLMFDEVSLVRDEETFPLLHSLASGQEKDRMSAALDVRQGHAWQSVYLSSANRSMRAMLSNSSDREHVAVLNRLLEIPLPPIDRNDKTWIADQPTVALAQRNYGHAGEVFAQWLVANAQRLPGLIRKRQEALMTRANADRDERLWFAGLSAILVGAELAKAAGLHDIDVAPVETWIVQTLLPEQRQEVVATRAQGESILADFLTDIIGDTVVVARSHRPEDAGLAQDFVIRDIANGRALKARYEQSSGRAYIARRAFRAWCQQHHVDYLAAIEQMVRHGQLIKARCQSALGRGLPKYGAAGELRSDCLCVQATDDIMGVEDDDDSGAQ